jgi:hypothetical protein
VASEAEEMVAGDELAPGPEVHGASSSGVLRKEGKVGVRFPGSDDDGVVRKRVATVSSSGSYVGNKGTACTRMWRLHVAHGAEVASWSAAPVRDGGSGNGAVACARRQRPGAI